MVAFLIIPVLAILFIMLIRNVRVFRYRMRISDIIFDCDDYVWRLRVYQSVTYDEMMYKFWKPLNSFYPDKAFLNPKEKEK